MADAKSLKRQLPKAEFIAARSMLELRTKPERLMPRILDFMNRVSARTEFSGNSELTLEREAANG